MFISSVNDYLFERGHDNCKNPASKWNNYVPTLVRENFATLMLEIADSEVRFENARFALLKSSNFDAYSAFRKITTEECGGVTLRDLANFLRKHKVSYNEQNLENLFRYLDSNHNGVLAFVEFSDLITKNKQTPKAKNKAYEIDSQTEMMLLRTFEQLLTNEVYIEEKRKVLWNTPGFQENPLFDLIDYRKAGKISDVELYSWLKDSIKENIFRDTLVKQIFQRMKLDMSESISYDKFIKCIVPFNLYKKYHKMLVLNKERSKSPNKKKLNKSPEKVIKHTKYNNVNKFKKSSLDITQKDNLIIVHDHKKISPIINNSKTHY